MRSEVEYVTVTVVSLAFYRRCWDRLTAAWSQAHVRWDGRRARSRLPRAGSTARRPWLHFDGFEYFREGYSRVLVDHGDVGG